MFGARGTPSSDRDVLRRGSVGGVCSWVARLALVVALASIPVRAEPAPRSPRHYAPISEGLPKERITAVASAPGDPEILFAGTDGFVFKSDDGGGTWRPVLSFPRGLSLDAEMALQDASSAAGTPGGADGFGTGGDLAVGLGAGLGDGLDLYDSAPQPPASRGDFDERPEDLDLGDADDISELEELQDELDDARLGPVTPDAAAVGLPAGDADLLSSFPRQEAGVRELRFAGSSSSTVYVATPRGLFRSVDTGETFTQIDLPGGALANDVRDVAIDPARPSRLWVATADGTFVTSDGGAAFVRAPDRVGTTPGLAVLAQKVGAQDLVIVGTERGAWRSWDAGTTFLELLLTGVSAFESVGSLAFDERTGITYAGALRGLFAGERDAALLEPRRALFGEPVYTISIDPKRERGVAVGLGHRGVVQSDDTGISFVEIGETLPATTAYDITRPADEPDALIVASERGVFQLVKGTGIRVAEDRLQRLLRVWKKEPSLQETAMAAIAYGRLEPELLGNIVARARFAPLLPQVRVSLRYLRGRPDVDEYIVAVEDPDAIDENDAEEIIDLARNGILIDAPSRGVRWQVFALATWDLDEVIYNPAEVAAARQLPGLFNARQRVLNQVETLYTARRRLMTELYLGDKTLKPEDEAKKLLRLAELTALLSGMTGGAFVDLALERGAKLEEISGVPERRRERDLATLSKPRRR